MSLYVIDKRHTRSLGAMCCVIVTLGRPLVQIFNHYFDGNQQFFSLSTVESSDTVSQVQHVRWKSFDAHEIMLRQNLTASSACEGKPRHRACLGLGIALYRCRGQ